MGKQVSDVLIRDLDGDTRVLDELVRTFAETANADWLRLPIHCFYETGHTEILRSVLDRSVATYLSTSYTNRIVSWEITCVVLLILIMCSWWSRNPLVSPAFKGLASTSDMRS